MHEHEIKNLVSSLIGEYGWMLALAVLALMFKNLVQRLVEGLMFFASSDYNIDDIVYIHGNKKARITRLGITKTTFYLYDTDRKLIIRNDRLSNLNLEKSLPQNGGPKKEQK